MNEIQSAIASLGSRDATGRKTGLRRLVSFFETAASECQGDSDGTAKYRTFLSEFQKTVFAARGAPLVVRLMRESSTASDTVPFHQDCAWLVKILAVYNIASCSGLAGCIEPLIALLGSISVDVQFEVAKALGNLSRDNDTATLIVAAGGIPAICSLLASPSQEVKDVASETLHILGTHYRPMAVTGEPAGFRAARLREIPVAMTILDSREAGDREAGVHILARTVDALLRSVHASDTSEDAGFRTLSELQSAVCDAGGVALLVRVLRDSHAVSDNIGCHTDIVFLLRTLSESNTTIGGAVAAAGGIAPLVALLESTSVDVQSETAGALCNLAADHATAVMIVAARGIPRLEALLRSPVEATRLHTFGALQLLRDADQSARVTREGGTLGKVCCSG